MMCVVGDYRLTKHRLNMVFREEPFEISKIIQSKLKKLFDDLMEIYDKRLRNIYFFIIVTLITIFLLF